MLLILGGGVDAGRRRHGVPSAETEGLTVLRLSFVFGIAVSDIRSRDREVDVFRLVVDCKSEGVVTVAYVA